MKPLTYFSWMSLFIAAISLSAAEEPLVQASWSVPKPSTIQAEIESWLKEKGLSAEVLQAANQPWQELPEHLAGDEQLRRLIQSAQLADTAAKELIDVCEQPPAITFPATFKILNDDQAPRWLRNNLRLQFGSWLARHERYDEAAEQLTGLQPAEVVDPAGLLFYQAVAAHRLLKKDECLPLLKRLLENKEALPQRMLAVAKLMQQDIEPLEADSLDEVARLMDDVRRRLELGRAGKKVREEEQAIIAKLEKKIDELEKKRQQQQQQQQANQAKQAPSSPAQESKVPRDIHASDETDPKKYAKANNWGNLPPKQRQQALQQIGRDLPSHFRDTIEEYFKRLAQDGNE